MVLCSFHSEWMSAVNAICHKIKLVRMMSIEPKRLVIGVSAWSKLIDELKHSSGATGLPEFTFESGFSPLARFMNLEIEIVTGVSPSSNVSNYIGVD